MGLTLGVRQEAGWGFIGGEVDADISGGAEFVYAPESATCAQEAFAPYMCTHDATIRLRAVIGADAGNGASVFGTFGLGIAIGDSAIETNETAPMSVGGTTFGLGFQRLMGSGTARIEVIYDDFTNILKEPHPVEDFDPTYEAVTVKVSYLFPF